MTKPQLALKTSYKVSHEYQDEPGRNRTAFMPEEILLNNHPWVKAYLDSILPRRHFKIVITADKYRFTVERKLYPA